MTSFECILELLRTGFPRSGQPSPEAGAFSGTDWTRVLEEASDQGVTAICYEAIKKLPSGTGPDFGTMLRWDISARGVTDSFEARRRVKEHLRDLFASKGLRMLLLKGETLADNYPDSRTRECGDIDFMLPDGYGQGNRMIEELGIVVDYSNTKHSVFEYEGTEAENHDPVPHTNYNRCDYRTEVLVSRSLVDAVLRPDGCWELPPVTMAVHAINHMALHLYMGEKVHLKMLCDIEMLLRRHPGIREQWSEALEYTGLTKFTEVILECLDQLFTEGADLSAFTRNPFVRNFVIADTPKLSRILLKYRYIPRTLPEAARELLAKFFRVLRHRLHL